MLRVAVAVVDVISVVAVADRLMTAVRGMGVAVAGVLGVQIAGVGTFVPVGVVLVVGVALVQVVDVVTVGDRGVLTASFVRMRMTLMGRVAGLLCHGRIDSFRSWA